MRLLEPERVGGANDELAHGPRRHQASSALGLTEPRQVDRHQVGVLGEPRPRRLEREQALRPRAQQEGVVVPLLALGEADRQPIDGPELGWIDWLNVVVIGAFLTVRGQEVTSPDSRRVTDACACCRLGAGERALASLRYVGDVIFTDVAQICDVCAEVDGQHDFPCSAPPVIGKDVVFRLHDRVARESALGVVRLRRLRLRWRA